MEKLIIEETKYTPFIKLDNEKGLMELVGKSYPENTFEFYKPMLDWVEEYFEKNDKKTIVNMEIIYFNSSSSKLFFDFFDLLEEAHNNGKSIEINWIYDEENESALEAGEDFKEDFEDLNFNLIEK
ncbi:DUF1987 domain-containing protein [Halarcobacter sp.]|uniref:DUF1987 domain-containing protein n=1 Tax=Halarcobacter sp. TaxID=2321133 RepID=UPI002AAAA330|nr:DUF1987 domain-containing protein [Halarcobacter sp.]|eukprot:Anaeramoba_ignava/a485337_23.p2 GENE.a485337_23~~a485337_23.p2  ORF type:complete len:126 (-),score=33.92 a485337_23:244-621(-)